jgi:hypothetical protein
VKSCKSENLATISEYEGSKKKKQEKKKARKTIATPFWFFTLFN